MGGRGAKAEGLGTRMCGGQVGGDSGLGLASIQGCREGERCHQQEVGEMHGSDDCSQGGEGGEK